MSFAKKLQRPNAQDQRARDVVLGSRRTPARALRCTPEFGCARQMTPSQDAYAIRPSSTRAATRSP